MNTSSSTTFGASSNAVCSEDVVNVFFTIGLSQFPLLLMVLDLADPVYDFVGRVNLRHLLRRRDRWPWQLPLKSLRVSSTDRESWAGAEGAFDVVSVRSWSHGNFVVPSPAWYREARDGRAVHFDVWIISSRPWIIKYSERHEMLPKP